MSQEMNGISSLLAATDWAEEWKALQLARKQADDASYWDERSKTFGMNDKPSDYAQSFIELAGLRDGESVFDMGCGSGALALPLARAGHEVLAADFSQGMLNRLIESAAAEKLSGITTKQLSWEDDWEKNGIAPKSYDCAFASRSIATADLKDSLMRLNAVARRSCCITLSTSYSPRCDERILRAIGLENLVGRDFWYAVNILIQRGYTPELRYIKSARYDSYDSPQEAWENLTLMLDSVARVVPKRNLDESRERLKAWFDDKLIENPRADEEGQSAYTFAEPRMVNWAFISWDVDPI